MMCPCRVITQQGSAVQLLMFAGRCLTFLAEKESRPAMGSSRNSTGGPASSSLAMASCFFWPPDRPLQQAVYFVSEQRQQHVTACPSTGNASCKHC